MRWVATVYASFKALMIATLAGHSGPAEAQELSPDDRGMGSRESVRISGSLPAISD